MILVFGDSITQGYYDTQGGWVARLFGMLVKKYGVDAQGVFNLGISGDNASKIKARFNFDVSSRVRNRDDSIIFDFGINDSDQKAGKFASTPEQFARDIKELGDIARKYVDNVIFMNITPVDDQRVQPTAWNGELYYNNERIGQFNAVLDEYITAGGGVMI
ncbi:GDSL-type esterase/lipase family protein, partial [Candidatus Saccharibacteria bacterium]|nr:GDSL-type esterase/lipase family protein [Candidatus Saccharibacteria bacterium]